MNGKARFPNEITNLIDILRWHIFVVLRAFKWLILIHFF